MSIGYPEIPKTTSGPAWEIATLFPDQGTLGESDYLYLSATTKKRVEFTDGRIEVLPMPTYSHQKIMQFVFVALLAWLQSRSGGELSVSGIRIKIREGKFREPDVAFLLPEHADRAGNAYWFGADLVVEIVSPDHPARDLEDKRFDYAEGGIPEYWIVDPRFNRVTLLKLVEGQYVVHAEVIDAGQMSSALLDGFKIDVAAMFAAGQTKP